MPEEIHPVFKDFTHHGFTSLYNRHHLNYVGDLPMAAQVEIYTWSTCPFCVRAKSLLDRKGTQYTEYCLDGDEAGRQKMAARAGGRKSVPQVFINDQHIGGCDDIHALEAKGELDNLLQGV
jgi:glutaredoxin 3